MATEIKTNAILKNISVRKEGAVDAKETAFDLRLTGSMDADLIDKLMCHPEEAGRVKDSFWDPDGIKKIMGLGSVRFDRLLEHANTEICGLELRDCTVKAFSFVVKDGFRAEMSWTVSSTDWPSNTLAILAEQLHEIVDVRIYTKQGDLFDYP